MKRKHPLGGLLLSQFTGAFNDNAWKVILPLLGLHAIHARFGAGGEQVQDLTQNEYTLALVVFTLPLMFISLPAAVFSDRFSKRTIIIAMKAVEIVIMSLAALTLWRYAQAVAPYIGTDGDPERFYEMSKLTLVPALVVLGFMGVQSAVFSPAKYGILPEILPHEKLAEGNGVLELLSFLAIIVGTGLGGVFLQLAGHKTWLSVLPLVFLSCVGFFAAFFVPQVPAANTSGETKRVLREAWQIAHQDRKLWLTIIGLTAYWALASLLGQDIMVYSKSDDYLGLSDSMAAWPLTAFAIGAGAGSVLAGKMSAGKIEIGLIPMGALGLGIFTLLLGGFAPGLYGTLIFMCLLGISSGLVVVPLHALLQWRAPAEKRGAIIAVSNVFVFGGILCGSLGALFLSKIGLSARGILVGSAIATCLCTIWALYMLPEAFLRLCLVLLKSTVYRVRIVGVENVPAKGGALLVPNHVTFADGLFLITSLDRPVRFIVDSHYFHTPFFRPFLKVLGAIPISASGGPRVIMKALKDAGSYLDEGEIVCIFAEGQLSRNGLLQSFRRGFEFIAKGRDVPIIPVHLDRLWGSIFSRERGRYITKMPRRLPYPVTISYGEQLPSKTKGAVVRRAVQELAQMAWEYRRPDLKPLHRSFISEARKNPFSYAFADATQPRVKRIKALSGAIAIARAMRQTWAEEKHIGILLPPSVGAGLVNIAASMTGKPSVNLNYTAGPAGIESSAKQAELKTVVTSREFLDKAKMDLPEDLEPIWLEEIVSDLEFGDKFLAFTMASFAPARWIERACGAERSARIDDVATIIFSSGSTGEPKGVMLTHYSIASNVEATSQVFQVDCKDSLLGILPLFHSFGYMSLWFAANNSMGVVFHPNPLDAAGIGELIQNYDITILLATPTFLQLYLKRCTASQFGSLRIVLAGAEKLNERLLNAFEDHFGIRPLEGYGTTECAPVIATSTLDFRAPGFFQPGSRRGYVGQPLPGVAVRIVDPETREVLPPGTEGMLLVNGPNIMKGYLGKDELTAEAIQDGWYTTGDIGLLDEDGFLKITDRLSRFSKIGGEMVPHGRVEEALQEAAEADQQVFAVTSISDDQKGERLAVLCTIKEEEIAVVVERLKATGLPNLFIPRENQFLKVEELPLLGTGKLDLRQVKKVAEEMADS